MTNSKHYPDLDVNSMYVPPIHTLEKVGENVKENKPLFNGVVSKLGRGSGLPPASRVLRKALENALVTMVSISRQEARRMVEETNAELIKCWKRKARPNMRRRTTNAEIDVNPFIMRFAPSETGKRIDFLFIKSQKQQRIVFFLWWIRSLQN